MEAPKHPLAEYRERHGLSREALGASLGVAGLTIRRWEDEGVMPQGRMRQKILDQTGIRFSDFVAFLEREGAPQ